MAAAEVPYGEPELTGDAEMLVTTGDKRSRWRRGRGSGLSPPARPRRHRERFSPVVTSISASPVSSGSP